MIKMQQHFEYISHPYFAETSGKETVISNYDGEHLFTVEGTSWTKAGLIQLARAYCAGLAEGEKWGSERAQAQMRKALGL